MTNVATAPSLLLPNVPLPNKALGLAMLHSFLFWIGTFGGVQLAIPSIMEDFDVPVTTAVWIIIGYSVGLAGASLTFAGLSTFFERRSLILLGISVDILVMVIIFFSHSIYIFIFCRYLQATFRQFPWLIFQVEGVGGFPPEKRGKALGYSTISPGLGMMVSLPLTGFVIDHFGWRWLFMGSAIAFLPLIPLVLGLLPKLPPDPARRRPLSEFDFRGSALMATAMITIITAAQLFIRGVDNGPIAPVLAVVGITALCGFVFVELHTKAPVIALSVFRIPGVLLASTQAAIMGFVNGAFLLVLPFLFIRGFGWTAAYASSILFFQALTRPAAGPIAGRLADRYGSAAVILPAAALGIIGQVVLSTMGASPSVRLVVFALIFWGTAQALMQTANLRQIYTSLPASQLHLAPSVNLVVSTLGGTSGQALASLAIDDATRDASSAAGFADYMSDTLLVMTVIFATGMVVTQLLPRIFLQRREQELERTE